MPKMLQKFNDFWDTTLEPLCEKSIHDGAEVWANLCNAQSEEEKDMYADEMIKINRVDWTALDFIAQTVVAVNVDLIEERNPKSRLMTIYNVFSDDEYYKKFFKDNETCKEALLYKELAVCLKYGLTLL